MRNRLVVGFGGGGFALSGDDGVGAEGCSHTPGRKVIALDDMVKKIQVAAETREDPNFQIVARTDARQANH